MKNVEINWIHIHKNGRLFGFGVSPNADWKVLFAVFTILSILVLSFSTYLFVKIDHGTLFVETNQAPVVTPKLNAEQLTRTLEYYNERALNIQSIKLNPSTIPDPSA